MPGQDPDPEGLPGAATTDPAGEPDEGKPADDPMAAALAQAPAEVRNSPEYKALEKVARQTARDLGRANRQLAETRSAAERERLAAEAERQTALETALEAELGEDGVAAFNTLAELSQSDPVAAARRFKEMTANAQSAPPSEPVEETPPTTPEAPVVDQASAVPPPPGGVDGNAPLQPPLAADELKAITDPLDERWQGVVDRNLTPAVRNRVTQRERAGALIGYLASSYLKTPEVIARLRNSGR